MMRILIASDSFKNSLSSKEIGRCITHNWKKVRPNDSLLTQIMADGGEGSMEVIREVFDLKEVFVTVRGPLGRHRVSSLLMNNDLAFVELSRASGIELIRKEERNVIKCSTFGTGQLVRTAIMLGAKRIYIFAGGSATHDLGMGMAEALGYKFFKGNSLINHVIPSLISGITDIAEDGAREYLKCLDITVLTDVVNFLTGEYGAARVYAKQKGATQDDIDFLEKCSRHLVKLTGMDGSFEGAGAAGGFGYGAKYFLGAKIESGLQFLLKKTVLEEKIKNVDLVITGEGRIDDQSIHGKLISGVSEIAKRQGVPCVGICALNELSSVSPEELNLAKVYALYSEPPKKIDISETFSRLKETILQMAREWTKE